MNLDLLAIIGPTASGKTNLATALAARLDAEILSGDSRQVYRGMDLGTGKDLSDYQVGDKSIPYHLIDIVEAGTRYDLHQYQKDFLQAYEAIKQRHKLPILCGGTGLYVEAVLKAYKLLTVPQNPVLRKELDGKSLEELTALLATYKTLHNKTDVDTAKRAIRAIEIAVYEQAHTSEEIPFPRLNHLLVGVSIDREARREKITKRLYARLEQGMVDEVKALLEKGIAPEDLIYYGLEYKYLTLYVIGKLTYTEMCKQLEIAIHQFAKRQMTWFRGMERRGFTIHWIDSSLPMEEKLQQIEDLITQYKTPKTI